jgi:hypothetical protein
MSIRLFFRIVWQTWRFARCDHEWTFAIEDTWLRRMMVRRCPKCKSAQYVGRRSGEWLGMLDEADMQ